MNVSERMLRVLHLLLGIGATSYLLYVVVQQKRSHEHHNRTETYCFTCDRGL